MAIFPESKQMPGAGGVEGVLDAPFDAVWEAATAFEHVGAIEVVIKEQIPEITRVVDVTDHASGANPYFAPD